MTYLSVHRDAAETVWETAAYFDGVNHAAGITAPALFSVALMDDVVPPRTTFAAYNALGSTDKAIEVYPYNGHEGGASGTGSARSRSWPSAADRTGVGRAGRVWVRRGWARSQVRRVGRSGFVDEPTAAGGASDARSTIPLGRDAGRPPRVRRLP